ncbi:ATP-binding protein [Streptomyces sp. MBT65]|uniref:AAA family ATPase n=1 Tax=Streptomyces sp. MBT65 TaxID=1488395 RepID=UPI0019096460|nr:AAA family ATPase [Streptomyces sp. MBT65]MBK3576474.1 ATP-binding protein [Streptomyces sp. MBT65]
MEQVDDFVGRRWALNIVLQSVSTPSGAILITGQPGAGKSRLARRVLDEVTAQPSEGVVTVWHECRANDDSTLVPWQLVTRLIQVLSAASPDYVAALSRRAGVPMTLVSRVTVENACGSQVSGVSIDSLSLAGESARSALIRYVRGPLEEVDAPPALVVLIDGLDEANSPGLAAEFVDFVVHAVEGLRQSRLDVRFVLTCRTGEHAVLERVANRTLDLDRDEPNPGEDMHAYCQARLASTVGGAEKLAWKLSGKARGNYLYSRYAVSLLNEPGVPMEASSLPAGLDRLYETFLQRRVAHDLRSRRWREEVRPALAVISVAREPGISSDDVADVLALPRSVVGDVIADLQEFLRLDEATGCWRIFHESFRSFLHSWAPLKISAEEAHVGLGHRFLEDPQHASQYLRAHFAHHLNRAGLHASLCDYVLHAEGVHGLLRALPVSQTQSIWQTACKSALELADHRRMAGLLARRLQPSAGSKTGGAPDTEAGESLPTNAFGDLGDYDDDVIRNLALACLDALRPSTRYRAVERLNHMISRCRYIVQQTLQYEVAALLADLHEADALHHLARELADSILDHRGLAFMQRFRIDRGAVVPVVTDALDTDSERYRFGLMKYAITISERRRRSADAAAAAHLAYVREDRWGGRNAFEDVATAAALPWIPRTSAGDLSGILRRTARTPLYRAAVLSSVGRPEVAGDAPHREAAIAEMESCRLDTETGETGLWWDLYCAIAWRRHGHADQAHRLLNSVTDRMPDLAGEPDGRFVAPVHRDVVHGPCLQGLVLECSLELATLGDFERSRRLAVSLLEFAAEDGVTAFLHLVHQMQVRAVAESEITNSIKLFFALADRNLPRPAADLAAFQAARGFSALIGPQPNLQSIMEKRLRGLCAAEQTTQTSERGKARAVLASALAYAFERSGDTGVRDQCLSISRAEATRQLAGAEDYIDLTLFRYLALSDEASPVANLLRDREPSGLRDYITYLRDYLADRDDHMGVARLSALLDDDPETLSTACLQLRALEYPIAATAVVEICRTLTDSSIPRSLLLAYAIDMVADGREVIHEEIDHEIEAAKASLRNHDQYRSPRDRYPFDYQLALALARSGRTEEALRWQEAAVCGYDQSVEWYRIGGIPLGGNPYYNDRFEAPDYEAFEESVAYNMLDADRELAAALAAAGETGPARDMALAIAADRDRLVDLLYGSAADLDMRSKMALRAAAECGAADILNSFLKQVRNRALAAAWAADHIETSSLCHRPPVHLGSLSQLAAATMGNTACMARALAALIVADPAMVVEISSARWLDILAHEKGRFDG